jgi:TetR/AcrR family transcriptional regulator, mexCD-oprJ operon repressor
MPDASSDHRTATAERNVEAILDATEALLARGAPATTTAVAAEAGVSRVTVYAHFPTREALLEGVTERVVTGFAATLVQAELDQGPAPEALARLIALAWSKLDHYGAIADAVIGQLSSVALARAHTTLHEPISRLIARGQAEGSFRSDLPPGWLLSCYFALVHACGDQVRSGVIEPGTAVGVLQRTIGDLFASR